MEDPRQFINPEAQEITLFLESKLEVFERRKAGRYYRGMILAVAEMFKDDRDNILQSLKPKHQKQEPKEKRKLPKVTSFKHEPEAHLKKHQPCDSCPGGANFVSSNDMEAVHRLNKQRKEQKDSAAMFDLEKNPFESIPDILARFQSNGDAMKNFCNFQGITLPASTSKPETIAKYILAHYEPDEEEE